MFDLAVAAGGNGTVMLQLNLQGQRRVVVVGVRGCLVITHSSQPFPLSGMKEGPATMRGAAR